MCPFQGVRIGTDVSLFQGVGIEALSSFQGVGIEGFNRRERELELGG